MLLDLFLACSGSPAERDTWSAADEHYDCTPVDQYLPGGKSAPSGYEYCALDASAGFMHRVEAVDIADVPDPDATCFDEAFPNECKSNADCENGSVCEAGIATGCRCTPQCRTDADCGEGLACVPRMLPLGEGERVLSGDNHCLEAACLTDADCPSEWCVLSSSCLEPIGGSLHCFSAKDDCRTSADCDNGQSCYYTAASDGPYQCNDTYSCGK